MGWVFVLLFLAGCNFKVTQKKLPDISKDFSPVIYGKDNRQEVYASSNSLFRKLAESVAAMIPVANLSYFQKGGWYQLSYKSLEERFGYCSSERFFEQPVASECTGFLVGADLLLTAAHCIKLESDCNYNYWFFNFEVDEKGSFLTEISPSNIYSCVELIEKSFYQDYSLVRLDRVVKDRNPLTFRREGKPGSGDPLAVIGHPLGLPKKIADHAWIRDNSNEHFFMANLDTYSGSSGSPVFNAKTGVVEGILSGGAFDYFYVKEKDCHLTTICEDKECSGENVSRITNVKYLQDTKTSAPGSFSPDS